MIKQNKIKAPKYAYGASEVNRGLQGTQIALGVGSNVALIGGAIPGKWGKIIQGIGATISLGASAVGHKGSVDPVTGLVLKGSGIIGLINKSELKLEAGMVNNHIAANLNSTRYAADWYSEHGYNDPINVASGGIIPNTLAYLDDGEYGLTPDGLEFKVPERGKPRDSNLVNVPVGTSILSDVKKPKGSKDTYAKLYEKNKAKTNMKGNDIYALNSKMLNDMYNKNLHNAILAMQESEKKNKLQANKYASGTPGIPEPTVSAEERKKLNPLAIQATINTNYNPNIKHSTTLAKQSWYNSGNKKAYTSAANAVSELLKDKVAYNQAYKDLSNLPQILKNTKKGMSFQDAVIKNILDGLYGQVHDYFSIGYKPLKQNSLQLEYSAIRKDLPNKINTPITNRPYKSLATKPSGTGNGNMPGKYGWISDALGSVAGLMGPLMNITAKSGPTNVPFTYTPKYAPNEYDIDPLLKKIDEQYAMAMRNANEVYPSTGAGMAIGLQAATDRTSQIARALAEKNNHEYNTAAHNADIYNDWGKFNANARHTAAVENAQDLAALNQIHKAGWSDLSTAMQTMKRDRRLMKRDALLSDAFAPFFEYAMSQEFIDNYNRLRKK